MSAEYVTLTPCCIRGSIPIPPQVMRPWLLLQCCERRLSNEQILDNVCSTLPFLHLSFTNNMVWTLDVNQCIHIHPFLYVHICIGDDVYAWWVGW